MHVALSRGPSPKGVNYSPRVELIAKGRVTSSTWDYTVKFFEIFLVLNIGTMANNFSPSLGSYVLNQFSCIVMFGMRFYVSASGAIQGHHGPLVTFVTHHAAEWTLLKLLDKIIKTGTKQTQADTDR